MASNIVLFGWNRPIPGRERASAEHFQDFLKFLTGLHQKNAIESFDVILLDPHRGDLNGFFMLKGESAQLDVLLSGADWIAHVTRATLNLENLGVIRGVAGDGIMQRMALWTTSLPA